ncbi:prepilin-type N-terminal cleavage/methylation domain-containing protein [Photobacterium sp. DA100]|uniref:type IV pilus modification PilV family protein n=1 Tax=Photobacterium sp. DA100 TaxID=3027472 RepID=UPI0024798F6C|nr:prepilin-type N-terminal cleavage/methylation domain-containing protein [Photobacterium sp. DA100]WEM41801.1 prepilin-type N-terminal cleavage/methylation domain-containing protein [Photobacterium sp. DA100]
MISKQKGFSLLEAVISLAVLSVGGLGLVRMQSYLERKADYALNSLEAIALAESKLDHYRTRSTISGAIGTVLFDGASMAAGMYPENGLSVSGSAYSFNRKVFITDAILLPGATSAAAKTIKVKIDWTDRWGTPHAIEFKTMVSRFSEFN